MQPLAQLVLELLEAVSPRDDDRAGMQVREASVQVPIESLLDPRAGLRASLPRGRLQTGFVLPIGRLRFVAIERAEEVA